MKQARSLRPNSSRFSEKGSVIFFILIGVALFAALSYSVASMIRQGSPEMITEQKAQLMADEIMGYGQAIKGAVAEIKISNGCSDADVSFENPVVTAYEHTPAVSDNCKIFKGEGGGANYSKPNTDWLDETYFASQTYGQWYSTGATCIEDVPSSDTNCRTDGVDNEDMVMFLHFIRKQVCVEINEKAGIANPGGEPPNAGACHAGGTKFTGTFTGGGYQVNSSDLDGRSYGCFRQQTMGCVFNNSYTFYQAINAR